MALREFLLLLPLLSLAYAACEGDPPELTNGNKVDIVTGELYAYTCNADFKLSLTGQNVIISRCFNGTYTSLTATCDPENGAVLTACVGEPSVPTESEATNVGSVTGIMKKVECLNGKAWLSGESARITTCDTTNWSEVLDMCVEPCDVPRDCHDVAELGLTDDEVYRVIPSGEHSGEIMEVSCEMSSDLGGHWTKIYDNNDASSSATAAEYTEGFGEFTGDTSFVGLEYLSQLSKNNNNMTLLVEIETDSGPYTQTYLDFSVGESPNYELKVGSSHGNAGNGLCPNAFASFDTANGWWGGSSQDIINAIGGSQGATLVWGPLEGENIKSIKMKIRPTMYDPNQCPVFFNYEPSWKDHTMFNVTEDRSLGVVYEYTCIGDYYMAGPDSSGKYSDFGGVECIQVGNELKWNTTDIVLPCQFVCPAGFNKSTEENRCFHFSTDQAAGIVEAAQKCLELNSSLALFPSTLADMAFGEASTNYLVGPSKRGSGQDVMEPPLPSAEENLFNCTTTCSAETAGSSCVVITQEGTYEYVGCGDEQSLNYICEIPGYCPTGFYKVEGACYKHIDDTSILGALANCEGVGASLAYPTSSMRMKLLLEYLDPNNEYIIGLNYVDDTWTADGIYTVDSDLSSNISRTTEDHDILKISTNSVQTIKMEEATSGKYVCQYYGPIGCKADPPREEGWDGTTKDLEHKINYDCDEGFFVNGIMPDISQEVTCQSILGQWQKPLEECIEVEVCENATIDAPTYVKNETEDRSFFYGGAVNLTCPEGTGFASDGTILSAVTAHCTKDDTGTYTFNVTSVKCDVCLGSPTVENATSDYSELTTYTAGDKLTFTCNGTFEHAFEETEQFAECIEGVGFNKTDLKSCKKVCKPADLQAPDNGELDEITANVVGTKVSMNCTAGFYLNRTQTSPNFESTVEYICDETGKWTTDREDGTILCEKFCTGDPPDAPSDGNTTWDGFSKIINTKITYKCLDGYFFGDSSLSMETSCNGSHWSPIDDTIFSCKKVCSSSAISVAAPATHGELNSVYFSGDQVEVSCPEKHANLPGNETGYNLTCGYTGSWTVPFEDDFICEQVCFEAPPERAAYVLSNYTGINDTREGTVIEYTCEGAFVSGVGVIHIECKNGKWSNDTVDECSAPTTTTKPTTKAGTTTKETTKKETTKEATTKTSTTTATTTKTTTTATTTDATTTDVKTTTTTESTTTTQTPEIVLETDILDFEYSKTTTKYFENLLEGTETMNEGIDEVETIIPPFGFGDKAAKLNSDHKQCFRKPNFSGNICLINLKECKDGFTIGVWVRPYFKEDDLIKDRENAEKKVYISSGGNTRGRSGFTIFSERNWICGLVSLGTKYWENCIFGQLHNDTWQHIGLSFKSEKADDNDLEEIGIKLYKDGAQIGSELSPSVSSHAVEIESNELLIGCTKNMDDEYEGFVDAAIDELAMWTPRLEDVENLNISQAMTGGYKKENENMSPKEIADLSDQIDARSEKQLEVITKLALATATKNLKPPKQQAVITTSSTPTGSSPTVNETHVPSTAALPPAEQEMQNNNLKGTYDSFTNVILNPKYVRGQFNEDQCKKKLETALSAGILLNPTLKASWDEVKITDPMVSPAAIYEELVKYVLEVGLRCMIPENKTQLCVYLDNPELMIHVCTSKIVDLKSEPVVELPSYENAKNDAWDLLYDRTIFRTKCFTDLACDDKKLAYASVLGKDYHYLAPSNSHEGFLEDHLSLGTKVHTFAMKVLEASENDEEDNSQKTCKTDINCLKKKPYISKSQHLTKINTYKKLNAWPDENESEIYYRVCVRWNEDVALIGAWSSVNCELIKETAEYSICACLEPGTYAVMEKKYDKLAAHEDIRESPKWLEIFCYVAFGMSVFFISIYILVVLFSKDLKDQFHLMGLCLAIFILLGTITTFAYTFLDIEIEPRKRCVIFDTLFQFFNISIGTWMCALAHASFRAVTAGVIGGKFQPYAAMSFGLSLLLMAPPYIIYGDVFCSIYENDERLLTFHIPQICFVCACFFYALVIFCNMASTALRKDNLIEDYGSFAAGSALLQVYFGIVFIFWFLLYFNFGDIDFFPASILLYYFMGTVLFLLIGLGSNRFRLVLIGQASKRREMIKNYGTSDVQDGGPRKRFALRRFRN